MQVAPKGAPGGARPPQAPPSDGGQNASGAAAQAVQMIQQGFQTLGKIMQAAGQNLPPEDMKMFQQAAQATDAFIQALTGPADQPQQPQRPQQSGPMAANANAGAKPAM